MKLQEAQDREWRVLLDRLNDLNTECLGLGESAQAKRFGELTSAVRALVESREARAEALRELSRWEGRAAALKELHAEARANEVQLLKAVEEAREAARKVRV